MLLLYFLRMKSTFLLLLIVAFSLLFHSYIPLIAKSFLYALSLSVKEILLFVLPFVIFCFIFNSVVNLQSKAIKLLALIVAMICISNFISTWIAYGVGMLVSRAFEQVALYDKVDTIIELLPFWNFSLPKLIDNQLSIVMAFSAGLIISMFNPVIGRRISIVMLRGINLVLEPTLSVVIPIFIAGFMIKLAHDQILLSIIQHYFAIFLIIFGTSVTYVLIWHFILFRCSEIYSVLKNLTQPLVTGFSSMSSMIAMPLLIVAVKKNIKEKQMLNAVIPLITNFHLVGDCFAIPILALSVMTTFSQVHLDIYQYMMFVGYFVVAKFAVVAVPAGGVLVMLPILNTTMGFTDAMLSLIVTLYVMLDSIITPINIFGNSSLSILITRMYNRLEKKQ